MEDLKEIGERLDKYMKYKQITAYRISKDTGISSSQISNIINGKPYGIIKVLPCFKILKDLDLNWLMRGEGNMISETIKPFYNDTPDTIVNQSNNQQTKKKTYGEINANGNSISIENTVSENSTNYQNNPNVAALLKEIEQLRQENQELKIINRYLENKR